MNTIRHDSQPASRGPVAAMAFCLLLAACSAPPAQEQAEAPPPAPALNLSYNELMVTWIDNASHVLWDTEKEGFAPKDEADWLEIEDHATQLAAAGTLIQLPGTGPGDLTWSGEDGWRTNARLMSDAGTSALAAARNRSLPALIEANGKLVQTCEGCHKQFKPELPSEGVAHQRPHSESHAGN